MRVSDLKAPTYKTDWLPYFGPTVSCVSRRSDLYGATFFFREAKFANDAGPHACVGLEGAGLQNRQAPVFRTYGQLCLS